MIPTAFLQDWSTKAPWPDLRQTEQELVICRALCDLFNATALRDKLAFRGGTAIHKLLFKQPLRYSEDIDLMQIQPEPIGATVDAVRNTLSWLGKCSREQAGHSMRLTEDVAPMLPASMRWSDEDAIQAFERVWTELISRISGEPWKLADSVIEELRAKRYPSLSMPRDRRPRQ